MLLHSIIFIVSSMGLGLILFYLIYWKNNHAIVYFGYGCISDIQLLIILAVVGLFLSFLR